MGYFTETMALFEFKGDAELAYERRRDREKYTNVHSIGKAYGSLAKAEVNSNAHNGGTESSHKNINDIANDYSLGVRKKDRLDGYSKSAKSQAVIGHMMKDSRRERAKENASSCKESFEEAFASVIL